jgi:phenylacetate-CoA ligase
MNILRLLPRFREAYRAVEQMAEREHSSRGQIEEYQLHELNLLWQHAIKHVPYYRNLHRQSILPDRFCNLEEFRATVPLLPKYIVRQHADQFLSEVPRRGTWESTSGSTGTPTRLYHDVAGHLRMQHAKYRLYGAWGVDILDPVAYLWDRPCEAEPFLTRMMHKSKLGIKDALRRRKRFSAYNLDRTALHACLSGIERASPRAIYGFSNAVYMLAQAAAERGFSSDGLKAVIMTSELVTPRMQEAVQKSLGAPAVVEYGATECELIAGQYPDGTLRVREDVVLLEALPLSEAGCELVLTVLRIRHSR